MAADRNGTSATLMRKELILPALGAAVRSGRSSR
jgi:hypothetical protein